jgi:SNF2 family DNA or RNA helicase
MTNHRQQSLMNFILPSHFAQALGSLHAIFKVKGDSKVTLLSQERISRAKKMMTPFVLRRRKDQVSASLLGLPDFSRVNTFSLLGTERSPKKDGTD